MDSVRVGTVLLLTMLTAHVDASGGACSKESPSDVAALLQGALGVQRVTDATEPLPAKANRGASDLRQEEEEEEDEEDQQSEVQADEQQEEEEDQQSEVQDEEQLDESQTSSEEAGGDEQQETDGAQDQEELDNEDVDGHEVANLLEVDAQDVEELDEQSAGEQVAQRSLPSGWFGDFSQGESSFTPSGVDSSKDNPEWIAKYGSNPSLKSPLENSATEKSEWFQETPSGGPDAAWQTNFPALAATIGGSHGKENPWRRTPSGWVQDYLSAGHGPNTASWFDSSVRQIDGFGREMEPEVSDPNRYVGMGWKKRAVSATLTCKTPGCKAQASLQLFDASKEEAHLCSLSVAVHPTDYDDDYSREHIEFVKINAHIAARECNPKGRGCNATLATPLHPCLKDFNVDKLVDKQGKLVIEAKNSALVDECPYKGNLLSGVATASCMVRNKQTLLHASTKPKTTTLVGKGVLKCVKPGCTAETMVHVSPTIAQKGGKCTMNMMVYQTDFDSVPEQIDFIQVGGKNVTTAPVKPGKNPCNMAFKGKKPSKADRIFAALTNHDVTKLVAKSGAVRVKARISANVDECAYKGNLLYGDVIVSCVPSSTPAKKPASKKAPAKKAPAKKPSSKKAPTKKGLAPLPGKKA